ncbi:zinc ribbon domain-containing protein [Trichothermofontia sichuanensis B231]|uniref:zinc ribbon domain-containing protein n=1 Tax=Trichothermofontia sichuanensis TaxID=3045816 RepID=UPI0022477770|nr:zinc ribbon domain-containing protein [Trichothermofontia sichuanensis]UZQ55036.1 zinc ribbon domain-containing protein [Trichothermofontia sichuanensis B231]
MAYGCEIGPGRSVYLDNLGNQTVVTIASSGPGQQQQASNSFTTGVWTQPPQIFQAGEGVVIRISTAQGYQDIQILGSSMSMMSGNFSHQGLQQLQVQPVQQPPSAAMPSMPAMPPMQPMPPMPPMPPMQPMPPGGGMQMSLHPMEMRMGNMEMRMGDRAIAAPSASTTVRRFCSQCGAAVQPGDRFCASCGHQLA